MKIPTRTRFIGDEDDLLISWYGPDDTLIDLSSGYTFELKVASIRTPETVIFTKTSGFTGAATAPNLTVQWLTSGELNSITATGRYVLEIVASDGSSAQTTMWMFLDMKERLG